MRAYLLSTVFTLALATAAAAEPAVTVTEVKIADLPLASRPASR